MSDAPASSAVEPFDAVDVIRALVPAVQVGGIHNRQPCLAAGDTAASLTTAICASSSSS